MNLENKEILLTIAGLGIIFYSPKFAEHIKEGEDYLSSSYTTEEQVQAHIQQGTIVGFGTGSPGIFRLKFHSGYPDNSKLEQAPFKLRLGLRCEGTRVCFRDLYDLMDWRHECALAQSIDLDDGIYHITLCSFLPPSGILGNNQVIDVYLHKLNYFPELSKQGIPTLCM